MKKIYYFTAAWCQPCKQLSPIMEELQSEGLSVQKIDVDTNPEAVKSFGVKNIPTVILTLDGIDSGRKLGLNPKSMYIELYNKN